MICPRGGLWVSGHPQLPWYSPGTRPDTRMITLLALRSFQIAVWGCLGQVRALPSTPELTVNREIASLGHMQGTGSE